MAYMNGFFYKLPQVGKRYIFLEAADLWRGSEEVNMSYPSNDLEYMFPKERASGVITKIQRFKSSSYRMAYKLWIQWDGTPLKESSDTEGWYYHTSFVTLAPEEVPRYLKETQKVCISPVKRALECRVKAYNSMVKEMQEEVHKALEKA
jgi:hypothetical protein